MVKMVAMWTGRETLNSIENAISNLTAEEGSLNASLGSAVGDAERLRKEKIEGLKELARVKLDELQADRLIEALDAGERRSLEILNEHRQRIDETTRSWGAAVKDFEAAEAARRLAAADVEQALMAVEQLRAETEAKVTATASWRAGKAAFDEADAIAGEAEKKAAQAEAELGLKRKPYDEDPLFSYLWSRGYGTSRYSSGRIAKLIDRKVATYINFADARANYAMLIEIPLRLREHATGKRAAADESKASLARIEREAMTETGVPEKERVLDESRSKLAAMDEAVESKKQTLSAADQKRTRLLDEGSAAAYNDALTIIVSGDAKDDVSTLYREAQRTPTPADDVIVRNLEGLDEQIAKVDREISGLRQTAKDLALRRIEVEQVRDRFQQTGYDHPNTTFRNDRDIGTALGQVIEGVVRSGVLWDVVRQGYGYRQPPNRPDFGSPFPFPLPGAGVDGPRGGQWRKPDSRGGWSPTFDLPSGGRRDGDDFSTGGSF